MGPRRSKKVVQYDESSENEIEETQEEEYHMSKSRTRSQPKETKETRAKNGAALDWRSFLQNPMPDNWPGWLTVESDPVSMAAQGLRSSL